MHARGELTPQRTDLRSKDTGSPGGTGDTNGQEANGPTARDQHRFARYVFGQHRIDRIPQWFLNGSPFQRDSRIVLPHIDFRKRHVLRKGAIGIHAQDLEVAAHLGLARAALVAMPAGNMGFCGDQIAHGDALDVCAHGDDFSCGFMPKNRRQRSSLGRTHSRDGCAPLRRRDTMSRPHRLGRPHRSRTDASRMRMQRIHGTSDRKRWECIHHLVPPMSASVASRPGTVHRGARAAQA